MNISGPAAASTSLSERTPRTWLSLITNLAIVAVLYEVYELSRGFIPRNGAVAIAHADAVWNWEVTHGLFVEPAWQQFWLGQVHLWGWLQLTPGLITDFLNTGYLYVHFLGTIAFLFWLFFFRRSVFPLVRNIFFVTTAIALAIYILYPLAPPRLTPNLFYDNHHYHFIDTIRQVVNPKYETSEIGYNPYAAMPSLHFGWSLIIGVTLGLTVKSWPLRILGACYPLFMLSVIVVSGNHFFADAMGSIVVVSVSTLLVLLMMRWRGTVLGTLQRALGVRSRPGGTAPDSGH